MREIGACTGVMEAADQNHIRTGATSVGFDWMREARATCGRKAGAGQVDNLWGDGSMVIFAR